MIKENIALFKRFIVSRGLDAIYASLYNEYGTSKMPLDEFLIVVDSKEVLSKAFTLKTMDTKSPFRRQSYWEDMQKKFNADCLHSAQNGWYSQWNVKNINKWLNTPIGKVLQKGKPKEEPKTYESQEPQPKEAPKKPESSEKKESNAEPIGTNGRSQFKFFDLKGRTHTQSQSDDTLFVTHKEGSTYRVTFSKKHSEEILASGLKYMAIGQDEYTSAVRIVFNNKDGLEYPPSCVKERRVVINSRKLVKLLSELFGMEEEYSSLLISDNLANNKQYLTYQISKKQ